MQSHSAQPDNPEPRPQFDHSKLLAALKSLLDSLPQGPVDLSSIKGRQLKQLRLDIENAIERLQCLLTELDPTKQPPYVLDPSDPQVVGRLIADTLLAQERHPLAALPKFYGSGVYAIYYRGPFDAYAPIANADTPIYVGKADPADANAQTPTEQGIRLWNRLKDHRKSIIATELAIDDFECRYLVVRSAWQGTAESYLIQRFMPVWNNEARVCYGFGKHGDDPETRSNTRSPWDTLHPGRPWATGSKNVPYHLSPEGIKAEITEHFKKHPAIS